MLNIILCGAPGSGKGTQSELIVKKYGLQHLSTGDVLRAEIAKGSELGRKIDALISQGNLVPDELMYGVIENYIAGLPSDCKGTIFDGYPRTVAQAESLTELLGKYSMDAVMIDLLVDEQLLIQRLIERGKVSGRADDNLNTIRHRIAIYHNQTEPIAHYYLHHGNYVAVNGNHNVEDVFLQIERIIDSYGK
jgi:adenylate kinase